MLQFEIDQIDRCGRISRRQWLRIGGLLGITSLAPTWNQFASAYSAGKPSGPGFGRAKSVILVFASGGQSQIDTWDPKPNAPQDVRGAFDPISTAIPGVAVCEHLPKVARVLDRVTLVRSMSHEDLDHGTAACLTLTGRYHRLRSANPLPSPTDMPTLGAVLKRVRPTRRFVYDAVHVNAPAYVPNTLAPGQDGGILGREFEPLVVGDVSKDAVAVPGLDPFPDLPLVRLDERRGLKETMDQLAGQLGSHRQALDMNRHYRQAYEMLSSPRYRRAFDLHDEPAALRDRYGRHRSGQACLLARRLVEAGVPLVTVIWNHSNRGQDTDPTDTDLYGWDTHNDIFNSLKDRLLPRFDESFSALIEDLDARGLLDETLVICLGEFGRAPQVAFEAKFAGQSPGRKHWANVYSIVMAGAGVRRGVVLGASDRLGGEPVGDRYGPWDVAATLFWALGIDPAEHWYDAFDRPFAISTGRPMEALYG